MSASGFAKTPKLPYYAVIFSAQRTQAELVAQQPSFLGMKSTRRRRLRHHGRLFESEEAFRNWKRNLEHAPAREKGRSTWYPHYELRVAKVERACNLTAPEVD